MLQQNDPVLRWRGCRLTQIILYNGCKIVCCCVVMLKNANTVKDAVKQLTDDGCIQPLLFKYQDRLWLKLDHNAVPVNTSCAADAFELLVQHYFVYDLQYPAELWIVYGFLEKMLGLKATIGKSVVLADFCQQVLNTT